MLSLESVVRNVAELAPLLRLALILESGPPDPRALKFRLETRRVENACLSFDPTNYA